MPNKKPQLPPPPKDKGKAKRKERKGYMLGFTLLVQKPLLGFREPTDLLEQIGPRDPTSLEN
jgi:hypothetical protein